MARDEFVRDIRRAVTFLSPRVEVDSPFMDPDYISRMLQGTDLWLAHGNVAAFRPEDFPDLGDEARGRLAEAVKEFSDIARAVAPDKPASATQRNAAAKPFQLIVQTVQRITLDEWLRATASLLQEAETWAREFEWPTRRYQKRVAEDFIGEYSQETLTFGVEGQQLALVPVGRFAPGTDGMFDLAVMPAYDSVMVVRQGVRWFIHPLPNEEGGTKDWSPDTFRQKSLALAKLP
jgi:hypothetical protein